MHHIPMLSQMSPNSELGALPGITRGADSDILTYWIVGAVMVNSYGSSATAKLRIIPCASHLARSHHPFLWLNGKCIVAVAPV
jgi:hypothetical protein